MGKLIRGVNSACSYDEDFVYNIDYRLLATWIHCNVEEGHEFDKSTTAYAMYDIIKSSIPAGGSIGVGGNIYGKN